MYRVFTSSSNIDDLDDVMCMANLRGNQVKTETPPLDFSFYFSGRNQNKHGIRAKVVFNPNRLQNDLTGVLELHSDWKFIPGPEDTFVTSKQIRTMKSFFQRNKVLFAAVCENVLQEDVVQDYFRKFLTLDEVIKSLDCYEGNEDLFNDVDSIASLEKIVRKYHLFNMND